MHCLLLISAIQLLRKELYKSTAFITKNGSLISIYNYRGRLPAVMERFQVFFPLSEQTVDNCYMKHLVHHSLCGIHVTVNAYNQGMCIRTYPDFFQGIQM